MNRPIAKVLPAILFVAMFVCRATGEHGCCAHCRCHAPCRKVCRLVCEEKKVEVFCYGCKCEDFCVPCRSHQGCEHCKCVCGQCDKPDPSDVHAEPKRFVWSDWFPNGAQLYTRTKLMRKSEKVTVPSYKWVVEDLCKDCAAKQNESKKAAIASDGPLLR